jgi:hypothetical protein
MSVAIVVSPVRKDSPGITPRNTLITTYPGHTVRASAPLSKVYSRENSGTHITFPARDDPPLGRAFRRSIVVK